MALRAPRALPPGGLLALFSLALLAAPRAAFAAPTPVVLMHGLSSNADSMSELAAVLLEDNPERYVLSMEIGNGKNDSIFTTIDDQVAEFAAKAAADEALAGGFHLVCHSQGSIICRAYVEEYNSPRVKTMILLAGPNAGFYCDQRENCEFLGSLPDHVDVIDEKLMYSDFIQSFLAPANYWKDPFKLEKYLAGCRTLPRLNNEAAAPASTPESRRANMESLDRLVLVGSPNDGTISPWQSTLFEFYEEGTSARVRRLRESELYDAIGLRTLNEGGRMTRIISPLSHNQYTHSDGMDWVRDNVFVYLRD